MSTSSNNITIISDLEKKIDIEDKNLIIVEDDEDTKQSTVSELKKCFSGDYKEPSDMNFYSSKKIEDIMDGVKRELSTFAYSDKVESIEKRIANIIAANGTGKDSEIIDARDGENTLYTRLERDIKYADDKYMTKVRKVVEGTQVSTGNHGYIDIYLKNVISNTPVLYLKSKNILNINLNSDKTFVDYTDTGFRYTQKDNTNLSVSLKMDSSMPKGKYFFFANIIHDLLFTDRGNIKLAVKNSKDDSAYTEFVYNQSSKFVFEAPKAFDEIKIIFNKDKVSLNALVEFKNIMLMKSDEYSDAYIPYVNNSVTISNKTHVRVYNDNYDISCSDKSAIIRAEYYENSITTESMNNEIEELKSIVIDHRDKCGLIENYGEYLFFDNAICETPTSCRLSYDNDKFMRNGVPSLKMFFQEDVRVNPVFTLKMKEYIENINSVSLVFYMDKTDSYHFTTQQPITISLCSDSYGEPEMVNYMSVKLNKSELVQGWNIIKKNVSEFTRYGRVNEHAIQYVKIEVAENSGLDNRVMYFNSVVFNQKMKPTVLLAFDGIYEEGINYTYPYLTTREIPATILANNRTTFSRTVLETIVNLRAKYGWDLGQYGCNPNKELLTHDDNAREQYLALKNAKEWLKDNLVYNPISYSAPYGNLRPITVPLLKDLGYKIVKTDSTGYCNFFDPKYDFAIPMTLMSNETTAEAIIEKIQYAIDNECCICIYTNNVTDYGDEISAKKTLLEAVINFILENKDKITMMTFSEFYNKCNS